MRKPIDLKSDPKRHIGHCELDIAGDGEICEDIAKHFYVSEIGARSLIRGMTETVENKLFKEYTRIVPRVTEPINNESLPNFTTLLQPSAENAEIVVRNSPNSSSLPLRKAGKNNED